MTTAEFTNNTFFGRSYSDTDADFHIITTDHPFMVQIGLGAFTTGVFKKWWDKEKNQKLIQPAFDIGLMFIGDSPDFHNFTGWRQETRSYTKHIRVTDIGTDWDFDEDNRNYTWPTLTWGDFNGVNYTSSLTTPVPRSDDLFKDDTQLTNLIEMNNFVRLKKTDEIDETEWSDTERARAEFIRDIKAAKLGGGLQWKSTIPFVINVNDATACVKHEEVTFTLQLFDSNKPAQNYRKVALTDFTVIDNPSDSVGTAYSNGSRVDGGFGTPTTNGDPRSKVSANLAKTYNEYTNKWESGTPQVVARLLTAIPASINEAGLIPDVDVQYAQTTEDTLLIGNSSFEHATTGLALPITMQNANPMQWSPTYVEPEGCRDDNKKKTLVVHNLANRSWDKGSLVILNFINGVWMPIEFGAGSDPVLPTSEVEGNWDFTYLMTSMEYYFNDMASPGNVLRFGFATYEQEFYELYYNDTAMNIQPNATYRNAAPGGYYQLTSWDFMGENIGGNRVNGNAIAQTQFGISTNGTGLGDNLDGKHVNGTSSAPFFGCVFTDGYDGSTIYDEYSSTSSDVSLKAVSNNTYGFTTGLFFGDVAADVNVFADINSNVGEGAQDGLGMFGLDNSTLFHLPADMALNAGPSGANNGRPISDINYIANLFSTNVSSASLQSNCETYFQNTTRYSWMYPETAGENPDVFSSAFDLSPLNNAKLEFRPLKAEVYASFEHSDMDSVRNQSVNERGEFGARGWNTVNDEEHPLSRNVLGRNAFLAGQFDENNTNQYESPSKEGLRYGWNDFDHEPPLRNIYLRDTAKFPFQYWDSTWTFDRSAGAVGIIGAVCTVSANSIIQFETENFLGMATTFSNGDWYPSWGGLGGDGEVNLNTTQLYVRIFTAWPRELTVYDHRFFAIHHFNYGAGEGSEVDGQWYFNSVLSETDPPQGTPIGDFTYPTGWFLVDKVVTEEVDTKVPTWSDAVPTHAYSEYQSVQDGDKIAIQTIIYKDAPVRDTTHWALDTQRRGKLLPYTGNRLTIGVGIAGTVNSWYVRYDENGDPTDINDAVSSASKDILITSQGDGYTDGDKFTTSGGSGGGVELLAVTDLITGGGGKIIGFTVSLSGYDFAVADFLDYEEVMDGSVLSSVKIISTESTGTGFEGYLVRGSMNNIAFTDDAPVDAIDGSYQLTPNAPTVEAGGQDDAVQILNENKTTNIEIANTSSDGRYDVYLHFHNDISHTFADKWGFTPPSREQMVRLEILPQ